MTGSVICFMKAYAVYFYCVTFLFFLYDLLIHLTYDVYFSEFGSQHKRSNAILGRLQDL
jgi:hypothetical protein